MSEYKPEYNGDVVIYPDTINHSAFNVESFEKELGYKVGLHITYLNEWILKPIDGDAKGLVDKLRKFTFNGEPLFESCILRDLKRERRYESQDKLEMDIRNGLEGLNFLPQEEYNAKIDELINMMLSIKET